MWERATKEGQHHQVEQAKMQLLDNQHFPHLYLERLQPYGYVLMIPEHPDKSPRTLPQHMALGKQLFSLAKNKIRRR